MGADGIESCLVNGGGLAGDKDTIDLGASVNGFVAMDGASGSHLVGVDGSCLVSTGGLGGVDVNIVDGRSYVTGENSGMNPACLIGVLNASIPGE